MKARLQRMERLRHLRALQELRREVAFVRSRIKLQKVEHQIEVGLEAGRAALDEARIAVQEADGCGWIMSEKMHDVAELTVAALQPARVKAMEAVRAAQQNFVVSKRETEQAMLLAQNVREGLLKESDRRTQAESDDRYAARKKWLQGVSLKSS